MGYHSSKRLGGKHMYEVICPKCGSKQLAVFTDHYFCRDCRAEFIIIPDHKKYFPDSCVFPKRTPDMFYRYAYYKEE